MKHHQIALGIILGIAAAAVNAEVDESDYDYKQYSAAGCGAQTFAKAQVGRGGGIFNAGTALNNITCPVILDSYYNPNRDYYLRVFRASGAASMSCYLTNKTGTSITTTTKSVSTTGSDSTLYFSSSGYPDAASLGCGVPAKVAGGSSGIQNYYVYEF